MADQAALAALRVVVVLSGVSVVDQQHAAFFQAAGQSLQPGRKREVDFGAVTFGQILESLSQALSQRFGENAAGWAGQPVESFTVGHYVHLQQLPFVLAKPFHGKRVDHLVGHDDPIPRFFRGLFQPAHLPGQLGRFGGQGLRLHLSQVSASFENAILDVRAGLTICEPAEQHGCQPAAAGPDFKYGNLPQFGGDLLDLPGHAGAEQFAQFGCGGEIAARPQLLQTGAVITQTRLIQRCLHVL